MELAEAIDAVRSGPKGPDVAAFFDFDGTLVHGFSGVPFFREVHRPGKLTARELAETMLIGIRGEKSEAQFERFMAAAMRAWRDHSEEQLDDIGRRLFARKIAGHLYPEAWQLIRAHEAAGHTLVVATSATRFQVEPAARELGIAHILCTQLEVADGVVTGVVAGKPLWRSGKANAVRAFAEANGIDLASSYAYSNGGEDVDFLATVGNPVTVNASSSLAPQAAERGWPALRFRPRGTPGPERVGRTVAAFATMFSGVTVGVLRGLTTADKRANIDRMMTNTSDRTLRAAGIELVVIGAEHAETRPAVVLFNHQSELDPIVLANVLGGGFTGIVKKELASNPVFGPLVRVFDVTFIDRQNTEKAKEQLKPVVDTLRSGLSVIISPEGTRSLSPSLGPFKKGAFHIAMAAGVPVLPIVIRNAGEMYWKNAKTIMPGRIDVAVLEPIDVRGWTVEDLDERVAQLRQRYVDLLENWPRAADQ